MPAPDSRTCVPREPFPTWRQAPSGMCGDCSSEAPWVRRYTTRPMSAVAGSRRIAMRLQIVGWMMLGAVMSVVPARAQTPNPFLGRWNITGDAPNDANVYWLEVRDDGGKLVAMFLNRGGSPVPGTDPKITNGELTFRLPGSTDPKPQVALRVSGDKLTGTVGLPDQGGVKVTGVRPPTWGACDANGKHAFGQPVALFDGKSMDAWDVQFKTKPMNWTVEDGAMTNTPPANNLVSK